jgi:tape measure domain-containing protein
VPTSYEVQIVLTGRDQASGVLRQVEGALKGLAGGAALPEQALGGLVTALGRVGLAAQGLQSLAAPFQGLAAGIVDAASSTESFRVGLDRMAGSTQQAEAYYHDLVRFAAQTPFELSGLQDQTRRLAAVGFSLNDIIPLLKITGDSVAALGGSSEQLDRVTLALGQMHTRGKVSMEELNQLAEAGIPAFNLLAQGMGVTTARLGEMLQQGTVPADKSIRILLEGMQKMPGAAGAMAAQSQTLSGRLSNLKDAAYQLQAGIGGALGDALKVAISGLGDLVQNVQQVVVPVLQRYGPQIAAAIGPVVQQAVALATQAMTTFVGVVVGAGPPIARAVGTLASVFGTGLNAVLSVVVAVGGAIYQALQWLNPFARHSPSLVESVQGGVEAIGEAFGGLSGPVVAALEGARAAMGTFRDAVGDVSGRLGDQLPKSLSAAIALLGQGARPAFLDLKRALDDANGALDEQKRALADAKAGLAPYQDAVDGAKRAVDDQQRTLRDLRFALKDAQDALDPLKERYDDLTQAVKDADTAIRDLSSTPVQGTQEFERRTTEATNAVRQQEKALNDLKRSSPYTDLGKQIEDAERQIKDAQLAPDTNQDALRKAVRDAQDEVRRLSQVDLPKNASDQQKHDLDDQRERAANRLTAAQRKVQDATEGENDALAAQRRNLELLKRRQEDLLTPKQKELDQAKGNLEAIRLEKAAAVDAAEDRIKVEAALAKGIQERSEGDLTAAVRAAGAAKTTAEAQLKDVVPAYEAQKRAVEGARDAITLQEKAVADAQDASRAATDAYGVQKQAVDDLQTAYTGAKQEVAGFEAELRQAIQTARQAAQTQAEAAAAAKKAAKDAALDAVGPVGGIVPPGTLGVPKETQQQLDALKQSADGFAKSIDDARKSAEAFGKNVEAGANRAKAALADLGDRLAPVLAQLQTVMGPILAGLGDALRTNLGPALQALKDNAGPILAGVAAALLFLGGVAVLGALVALYGAITGLAGAAAAVGVAVALLTKAWTTNWGDIQGKTNAVWAVLQPILAGLGEALRWLWGTGLPALGAAWGAVWGAILAVVGAVWGFLSTEVFPGLAAALGEFTTKILPEFQLTWDAVAAKVTEVWTWLWPNLLQPGLAELGRTWGETWQAVLVVLGVVWEAIKALVGLAWSVVADTVLVGLKLLRGDWEGAWDAIRDRAAERWDDITQKAHEVWDALVAWIGNRLVDLQKAWAEGWDGIGATLHDAWETVKDWTAAALQQLLEWIVGFGGNAWGAAKAAGNDLVAGLKQGFTDDIQGFRTAVEEAITGILDWITTTIGSFKPPTLSLPNVAGAVQSAAGAAAGAAGAALRPGGKPGETVAEVTNFLKNTGGDVAGFLKSQGKGAGEPLRGGDFAAINPKAQTAVAWALQRVGAAKEYIGWCERFVENAFGTSGRFGTAWQAAQAITTNRDANAPRGTIVFFRPDPSNLNAGHVGLSLGDGTFVSATNAGGAIESLSNAYWKGLYYGWGVSPFAKGGWITEPILGVGASGRRYAFGEHEAELVVPGSRVGGPVAAATGAEVGGGGGVHLTVNLNGGTFLGADRDRVAKELAGAIRVELLKHGARNGLKGLG